MSFNRNTAAVAFGLIVALIAAWYVSSGASAFPPLYGRAIFGADAKNPDHEALLIVQGQGIFLDANGDGVAQAAEQVDASNPPPEFKTGPETNAVRYRLTSLRLGVQPDLVSEQLQQQLSMEVHMDGGQSHVRSGKVYLTSNPDSPGLVHFGGPLQIKIADEDLSLSASPEARTTLRVSIESAATENAELPATIVMPGKVIPAVDVEFPSSDPTRPIERRFYLDQFC